MLRDTLLYHTPILLYIIEQLLEKHRLSQIQCPTSPARGICRQRGAAGIGLSSLVLEIKVLYEQLQVPHAPAPL